MSKIGKLPVILPEGVSAEISGDKITITGPKGSLSRSFLRDVAVEVKDSQILVSLLGKSKQSKAVFGTTRALIANMVKGVNSGWLKELELVGTGYRAEVKGNQLVLTLGFSHPVIIDAPEGITFKVEKTIISIEGRDKELVGQVAANIRGIKPPEPYKGKGIKYRDEIIKRKPGKAAKTVGVPA